MPELNEGMIVILSSPSGAGKTTLARKISQENNYYISISHTTRKPRANEVNGKDYFFVRTEEFEKLIKNKKFLEYAKVFNNYYGSLKETIINQLNEGQNVIFDIDWQGAHQIKNKKLNYKLITFFVLPPSKEILFQRLSNRDMKDKLIVDERMKEFEKDILHWKEYDYVVINNKLDICYEEISSLIDSCINNLATDYDKSKIENHINSLRN